MHRWEIAWLSICASPFGYQTMRNDDSVYVVYRASYCIILFSNIFKLLWQLSPLLGNDREIKQLANSRF
jgi:hypothetical protein